jgi:hypothetical protein
MNQIDKQHKSIRSNRKVTRRIIKVFKLVAGIASIFKVFNLITSFFDFIVGLFDRD